MGGVTSDMLRKKRKEKPLTLHFPHRPFYIKGVETMQIIKVNTKDMNLEKAINYLISHHAALKVDGYKETAAAVHMGLNSLQAWKGLRKDLDELRQEYEEDCYDEALEVLEKVYEIVERNYKKVVEE